MEKEEERKFSQISPKSKPGFFLRRLSFSSEVKSKLEKIKEDPCEDLHGLELASIIEDKTSPKNLPCPPLYIMPPSPHLSPCTTPDYSPKSNPESKSSSPKNKNLKSPNSSPNNSRIKEFSRSISESFLKYIEKNEETLPSATEKKLTKTKAFFSNYLKESLYSQSIFSNYDLIEQEKILKEIIAIKSIDLNSKYYKIQAYDLLYDYYFCRAENALKSLSKTQSKILDNTQDFEELKKQYIMYATAARDSWINRLKLAWPAEYTTDYTVGDRLKEITQIANNCVLGLHNQFEKIKL